MARSGESAIMGAMYRKIGLLIAFVMAGMAQQQERIPAGTVAAHMIGRMVVSPDGVAELIGYFPFLEGIEGPFFNGAEATEKTAFFTFRSSKFRVSVLRNDPIFHLRTAPAEGDAILLRTYYQSTPNQEFANPGSFSSGQLIGEFQSKGTVTTVVPFTSTANTGSFLRITSADFTFRDKSYNFDRLAETITVDLKGAPVDLAIGYNGISVPFGGAATATAWRVTAPAANPY
jgi:hypothetical protein